jgi:hypothetical protein
MGTSSYLLDGHPDDAGHGLHAELLHGFAANLQEKYQKKMEPRASLLRMMSRNASKTLHANHSVVE